MEFVRLLGMRVSLDDPERPRCSLDTIESLHLGGIGQDFVNGAITSAALDLALGLTGVRYASMGYFATRNLHIDLTLPVEKEGFYISSRETSRIGKNLFCEATVFNLNGEPRVHATGCGATRHSQGLKFAECARHRGRRASTLASWGRRVSRRIVDRNCLVFGSRYALG
jgi:acyl-coenzyme A thioesterase PaaI-like protein